MILLCGVAGSEVRASGMQPVEQGARMAPPARHALAGRVIHALSHEPVPGATVAVEGTGLATRAAHDGRFELDVMAWPVVVLSVSADGFLPTRVTVDLAVTGGRVEVRLDPLLEFSEAVSVRADTTSAFEQARPVSTLAGQELSSRLEATLGASLRSQPGVAERSSGPGASRPVIRGLDGDRVLILEDTQQTGDLSSQSADHGVNVNPATAARIEIVRGPATLLYGSSAIGGVVNVVTNTIPTALSAAGGPVSRALVTLEGSTVAQELAATGTLGWRAGPLAMRGTASGRRSGDLGTPLGAIPNTASRGGMGVLGISWVRPDGYLGGSYGIDGARYGLPSPPGQRPVDLTPRRHSLTLRGERQRAGGVLRGVRAAVAHRDYRHGELAAGEVGTLFANRQTDVSLHVSHATERHGSGTLGLTGGWRRFSAEGEEALAPPVAVQSMAAFGFHEVRWRRTTLQGAARLEHTRYGPQGGLRPRRFLDGSWSVGAVNLPVEAMTVALSVAGVGRRPALEELYFNGLHVGNFAFEIGNPDLASERALGIDLSWRWRLARFSGEVNAFRNAIGNYIFREPTGEVDDGYPVIRFVGRDAVLAGVESRVDLLLTSKLSMQGGLDLTRGWLADTREALPRMPPWRARIGTRVQHLAWQAGAELERVAAQDRVYRGEAPTAGATLLRAFMVWSFTRGGSLHTISARVDNATNRLHRNHLSYQRAFVPEAGRNLRITYSLAY